MKMQGAQWCIYVQEGWKVSCAVFGHDEGVKCLTRHVMRADLKDV